MLCPQCGKEVPEKSKFCVYCGASIDYVSEDAVTKVAGASPSEEIVSASPPPKKKRKKWIALLVAAVVIVVAGVAAVLVYTSPSAQFTRAVEGGDLTSAQRIYKKEFKKDGLPDKLVQCLVDTATQTQEAYLADEISYDEANERLTALADFSEEAVEEAVSAARNTIGNKHQIESLLQAAEKSAAAGDYLAAVQGYQEALKIDPNSEMASKGLKSAQEAHQQSVVDQAYDAKDTGDWDKALEILDTYQETYGQNEKISAAYKDLEKQRPVTLKNLTMVSSDEVEIFEEAVKDRWDNLYDGAVEFKASYDGYGYYSLEKKYTKFTGVIFVSSETINGSDMSVTIYKDDQIVYHLDKITENTPPASFEIDLTGASTMKIVTANESNVRGYLLFGNTAFEKAA